MAMPKVDIQEWTGLMADAFQKKVRKIPSTQRPKLVLALDATHLPLLAFDSVVESFREHCGTEVCAAGFQSVWVVGPTETLTKRLDMPLAL
jgi:hypothetical protein